MLPWREKITQIGCSKRVPGRLEKDWLMNGGYGHIHGGPGHAVRRATGHSSDLLSLQTLHQCGLPVNCGCAIPLLPMVIVTPRVHLTGKHLSFDFSMVSDQYIALFIHISELKRRTKLFNVQ